MVGRSPEYHQAPAARLLLEAPVEAGRVPAVRQQVAAAARECGLTPERTSDWVTAINELMANVVRHGGGSGHVRVWEDGRLFCEVRDDGPGFTADAYLDRHERPSPSGHGGMGLWIVRQMSDDLEIDSGPSGTVVRISIRLDALS